MSSSITELLFFCYSFSILKRCWDSESSSRPSFELLHETLLNILQQRDYSQLVEVTPGCFDEHSPSKKANSPTNESSDSAIGEDVQILATPFYSAVNRGYRKDSNIVVSTDLDESSIFRSAVNPGYRRDSSPMTHSTAVHQIILEDDDALPSMSSDGSTEI